MGKKALITGITGQDGSYLSELLLEKGYEVHGIIRRASTVNTSRIDHVFDPESRAYIHYGDLDDGIQDILYSIKPDEVYNLASMSHVRISFDIPVYTGKITGVAVCAILEAIRQGIKNGLLSPNIKFYQASSSEMFGVSPPPQSETTEFLPVSPYGCAKLYGYHITRTYRKGFNMFAANGILFNHESPRRGVNFVTRKITRGAARIKLGVQKQLTLGNLDARRDWGHAKDYMKAVWMILQNHSPQDWVVSTGEYHSVRDFAQKVFDYFDLDFNQYVKLDDYYKRPNEVPVLLGNSDKLRTHLGWKPDFDFNGLVKDMCENDYNYEEGLLRKKK
jgi:GDPmannose 4,6-dehydratase